MHLGLECTVGQRLFHLCSMSVRFLSCSPRDGTNQFVPLRRELCWDFRFQSSLSSAIRFGVQALNTLQDILDSWGTRAVGGQPLIARSRSSPSTGAEDVTHAVRACFARMAVPLLAAGSYVFFSDDQLFSSEAYMRRQVYRSPFSMPPIAHRLWALSARSQSSSCMW